jgi:thymidylate synthase ThyX
LLVFLGASFFVCLLTVGAYLALASRSSPKTPVANSEYVHETLNDATHAAMETYTTLLKNGVAPEIARMVLPQSMYTEFIETGSLAAYARLCNLRLDPSAQKEIREYADAVVKLLEPRFPVSWKVLVVQDEGVVTAQSASNTLA